MVLAEGIREGNNIGAIRVAYFLSTRELADNEPLSDNDQSVNDAHRGNLPALKRMLDVYNRKAELSGSPRIEICVIVCDDDAPRRDFSDLGIPLHQEPSSSFAKLRRAEGENPEAFRLRKAEAKADYENRLIGVMRQHGIDMVISDRYMRIFGPAFLADYLGLILNSHPAILPDNPGATPTASALRRSAEQGYSWTGNTLHIIDPGEDTGPAIMQSERTPVLPGDTTSTLRARNYRNEAPNMYAGLVNYVRDPAVRQLIRLRRELPGANGNTARVRASMKTLSQAILDGYRGLFSGFYRDRNLMEPGKYRYCARLMERRLARQRAEGLPRPPMRALPARSAGMVS
jgi:folate-dependent phosphoribosylglycinamide formyltransferase PurN